MNIKKQPVFNMQEFMFQLYLTKKVNRTLDGLELLEKTDLIIVQELNLH